MKPLVVEYVNVSGIMGREVSLTCKASGDPLPEVTFLREGTLIPYTLGVQNSDDRIIVDTSRQGEYAQARLVIRDLMRTDDGLYACIAKNSGKPERHRIQVVFVVVYVDGQFIFLGDYDYGFSFLSFFLFLVWLRGQLYEKWAHHGGISAFVCHDSDERGLVLG